MCPRTTEIGGGNTQCITRSVSLLGPDILDMDQTFPAEQTAKTVLRCRVNRLPQIFREGGGHTAERDGLENLAVIGHQDAKTGLAKNRRLFQDCVEDRREIAGRGVDYLQYLGGRGLLLQRLALLDEEPRILDCDDRL